MKLIVCVLLLAMLALVAGEPLAGAILAVLGLVLLVGEQVDQLPASSCNHNCSQGRSCTCPARCEP